MGLIVQSNSVSRFVSVSSYLGNGLDDDEVCLIQRIILLKDGLDNEVEVETDLLGQSYSSVDLLLDLDLLFGYDAVGVLHLQLHVLFHLYSKAVTHLIDSVLLHCYFNILSNDLLIIDPILV